MDYTVAIASSCLTFFLWSTLSTHSIIFVALYSSLGISRAEASWPFNLAGPATILGSLFSGLLSLRYSTKSICILGLLIYSSGISLCFLTKNISTISVLYGFLRDVGFHVTVTVTPALITGLYQHNRVTLMGLQNAGGALAAFVFPVLTQFLFDTYDLRSVFLLIGAISLNGIPAALYICDPPRRELEEEKQPLLSHENVLNSPENSTNQKINCFVEVFPKLKTIFLCPVFYLLTLTGAAKSFWGGSYDVLIVDFMNDHKIESKQSVLVVTACGMGQLVGYIGLGWIVDKKFVAFEIYLFILTFLNGVLAFVLTAVSEYWMFITYAIVLGVFQGATRSVLPIMFRNCLTQETLTFALGMANSIAKLTNLTRPPLIDYFRETIGSYKYIFLLNGGLNVLVSLPWLALFIYRNVKATKRNVVNYELL